MTQRHYAFVTVEGINGGCTHEEVGEPSEVDEYEIHRQGFAPGVMVECKRCGASRYLTDEEVDAWLDSF